MSRYLVTGATGFIGGHLAEWLISNGDAVRCLVRATSDRSILEKLDVEFVECELLDHENLNAAVEDVDVVVHLAGRTSACSRAQLLRVNRDGTFSVAQACARQTSPPIHVVVSSIAAAGPVARNQIRMEHDLPMPISNYGFSKRAGECAALWFADQVPTSIIRPGMVFGERNVEMLPIFRSMATMGSHVVIGPASPRVSMIHVDDLCELIVRVAQRGRRATFADKHEVLSGDGIYFGVCDEAPTYARLGSILKNLLGKRGARQATIPSPISWMAGLIAEVIARMRGKQVSFNLDKVREAVADSWECSVENVINDLDYEFPIRLEERLQQTIDWYRLNDWI
tara:strand:- start:2293 stop:3312 length:1020 start_codon:yes stop_codon:yes gene_type:complete